MSVGDCPDDREPKPSAACRPGPRRIGAVEALEHSLAFASRDPRTVIVDDEPDPVWLDSLDLESDQTVRRQCVLDGIAGQIA